MTINDSIFLKKNTYYRRVAFDDILFLEVSSASNYGAKVSGGYKGWGASVGFSA